MQRITCFLFSTILIGALTACESAPTAPTATHTEMPTATPTYTPSLPATSSPTNTPVLYAVSFQAFHDHNGNGMMDEGETMLEGIVNKISSGECTTGANGACPTLGIPAGSYNISIQAPPNFRFITPSIYEDKQLGQGVDVTVNGDTTETEPLVEGPYRSPLPLENNLTIANWNDIDHRSYQVPFPDRNCSYIQDWLGERNTYDGHDGDDLEIVDTTSKKTVEVHPMRSGIVYMARFREGGDGFEVLI
jgi:hypothetical protein